MCKPLFTLFAALAFLTSCDGLKKPETKDQPQEATQDTAVVYRNGHKAPAGTTAENAFDLTKAELKEVKFEEVNLPDVRVRGNDDYSVYGLEEKVLFDTGKSEIKASAANALNQIAASIGRRYANSQIQIMGFADSRGDKDFNRELSEKRAEAVKNWLIVNGKMPVGRLSVEPMGEAMPTASNSTAAGRQKNRRVEIAVRTKG